METTLIYVVLTQYGTEPIDTWVYTSRADAEQAIRLVAERDHGNFMTDLAEPPLRIADCIAMLKRCCGYGLVRLVQAELNLDPGEYEPVDLYPPSAASELAPA